MHLCRRPFRWPCRGVEAIHTASPDAACPGLLRKPLDAAIGRLLAPYHSGGHHGDSKQNKDVICTHFDGRFDAITMQRYYTARIAQWRRSMVFIKASKLHHRASTHSDITNQTYQSWRFLTFHHEKGLQVDMLAPNNNRGSMKNQTDEKQLTIFPEYIVGVVKLAWYSIHSFTITCLYQ